MSHQENGQKSAIDAKGDLSYANSMNGYELPIAMEVRRGRYLRSLQSIPHKKLRISRDPGRSRCAITTMLSSRATG